MKLVHERNFTHCKTAKDLYTNIDRLELLAGITIDQRKLLAYLCDRIDKYGAENPVEVDPDVFGEAFYMPGLTPNIVMSLGVLIAQRPFLLRWNDGHISTVRVFSKIQTDGGIVQFHFDEDLLALRKAVPAAAKA